MPRLLKFVWTQHKMISCNECLFLYWLVFSLKLLIHSGMIGIIPPTKLISTISTTFSAVDLQFRQSPRSYISCSLTPPAMVGISSFSLSSMPSSGSSLTLISILLFLLSITMSSSTISHSSWIFLVNYLLFQCIDWPVTLPPLHQYNHLFHHRLSNHQIIKSIHLYLPNFVMYYVHII